MSKKTQGKRFTDQTQKKLRNLKPVKPGQSGNPKGRPKGARNRLGTQFLEALEADFNQYGAEAIALVREKKPDVYMRVVADLLPKEANINVEAGEAFVKLWAKISEGLGEELADRLDEEPSEVLSHLGHFVCAASCSDMVSVRSNFFPHFSQRYWPQFPHTG